MGESTAADGETDLGIGIDRQAMSYGYQQTVSKCFENCASGIVFSQPAR
jgi:hypothetical protein